MTLKVATGAGVNFSAGTQKRKKIGFLLERTKCGWITNSSAPQDRHCARNSLDCLASGDVRIPGCCARTEPSELLVWVKRNLVHRVGIQDTDGVQVLMYGLGDKVGEHSE